VREVLRLAKEGLTKDEKLFRTVERELVSFQGHEEKNGQLRDRLAQLANNPTKSEEVTLDLSSYDIGAGCMRQIAHIIAQPGAFPKLEALILNRCCPYDGVTEALLPALSRPGVLPRLRRLGLENAICDGVVGGVAAVVASPGSCLSGLTDLDLSSNDRHDPHGVEALANALRDGACPRLTSLNLHRVAMTTGGATALAEALATGHTAGLTFFNVSYNQEVRDDGVRAIAAALSRATTCPEVNLQDLGMTALGAEALAIAIEAPGALQSLTGLKLCDHMGDQGLTALARALGRQASCPRLRVFTLEAADRGVEVVRAFAQALEAPGALLSLQKLQLYTRREEEEETARALEALAEAVKNRQAPAPVAAGAAT
jgi:hypothetical protein